ncbi:hypothetical protein [uncultured Bradyrhizobium sp.]|uniref:hypothetical protein n=1 Tax=Bradyrhizobium sp. TaxID=376 RepID=UPI00261BC946|nr:hypothetical protein [uncultured Bradyrhizobium sp.]
MEQLAEIGQFKLPLNPTRFDIQDHLKAVEWQTAYLAAALNDRSFVATAIADVAKARRMARGRKPAEG